MTYWAVPLFVVATLSLWLLDRPHRVYRWKVACLSGLAAAGLGLALSQAISHVWVRERPFDAHPTETFLLATPSAEPAFPSDHAVAAFAIAFSVLLVGGRRRMALGLLFLTAAFAVGITRVFVGLHYPGDVAGGAVVGLISALAVWSVGRRRWTPIVGFLSRLTDPLFEPAWRTAEALSGRLRARRQ